MPLRLFRSRNVSGREPRDGAAGRRVLRDVLPGRALPAGILGYSALEVGLAFLPSCIVMGTLSLGFAETPDHGHRCRASAHRRPGLAPPGLLLFARAPVDGTWVTDVLPVMLLLGTGAGLAFPALMTLAMSGATPSDAGLASGLVNTTVQVGGAIGLAVLATLATERTDALRADGESAAAALNSGYHLAFLIGALAIGGAIVVALRVLRPERATEREPATAEAG